MPEEEAARPASIRVRFGALPDPRVERPNAQLLSDILTILCAILCGGAGW